MPDLEMAINVADYHTAGEPFRIVSGGVGPIPGATILDKRRYAMEHLDGFRALIVNEPRGHADMYGCFVTDPEDGQADLGVLFFHNAGFSTACGHGTIALVTWALESGVIERKEGANHVVVDVPSGRLSTVAHVSDGAVRSVRFRNVPSFVLLSGLEVEVDSRSISTDVAYGGAFYACVAAGDLGLSVEPRHLTELIAAGRTIKAAVEDAAEVVHPTEPELNGIYGVIFFDELDDGDPLRQRNVTIFADGEVDRSPCGSGTSARLAVLDATGSLPRGGALLHSSIIETEFIGRVVADAEVAGRTAVITEVEGSAHLIGWHTFVLRSDDELGTGFLLR